MLRTRWAGRSPQICMAADGLTGCRITAFRLGWWWHWNTPTRNSIRTKHFRMENAYVPQEAARRWETGALWGEIAAVWRLVCHAAKLRRWRADCRRFRELPRFTALEGHPPGHKERHAGRRSKATIWLDTVVSGLRTVMAVLSTLSRLRVRSTALVANPWQSLTNCYGSSSHTFRKSTQRGPVYGRWAIKQQIPFR